MLIEELEDYADETRTDKLGNVFFYHKGDEKAPTIMLAPTQTRLPCWSLTSTTTGSSGSIHGG